MNRKFTACLLAGGKSSRMGRDKAGVEFEGQPLWQHQLRILRQTGAVEILISGRKDACYGSCGFPIIGDEVTDSGPLSGVASLLAAAAHPLVLVLAIDMPFITAACLKHLLDQCAGEKGVVPRKAGFFEGLAAIYPKTAHAVAVDAMGSDDHSMQHFVRECEKLSLVKIMNISEDEEALFQSLNSAADLAALPS